MLCTPGCAEGHAGVSACFCSVDWQPEDEVKVHVVALDGSKVRPFQSLRHSAPGSSLVPHASCGTS
jgi:hypothetical protein